MQVHASPVGIGELWLIGPFVIRCAMKWKNWDEVYLALLLLYLIMPRKDVAAKVIWQKRIPLITKTLTGVSATMTTLSKLLMVVGLVTVSIGCSVDKTQDAEMPEVSVEGGNLPEYEIEKTEEGRMPNVETSGGQMPRYDVDTPDVDVEMETREVEVPSVNVDMPDDEEDDR